MCNRGRQSRPTHPTGIGEPIANARPRGPITGADRFVGSDGNIRQTGRTTAQELTRLRSQLHPVDRLKKEAQDRILNYLNIPSEQFAEAQELIGMTRAALGGSPLAAFQLAIRMFMSGVEAMQAGQRIRDSLCSAYTFGYWVYKDRYPNLRAPKRPPHDLHQADVGEDNHGNYDHISASLLARRWNICNVNTLNQLHSSLNPATMRTDLMRRFGNIDFSRSTDTEILQNYKLMILSAEFSDNPRLAASTFFLATIQNLSSTERRVATILYRRHPYDP